MTTPPFPVREDGARSAATDTLVAEIESLDEATQWPLIVTRAFEAGLDREEACLEFSCSWSTVTRWMAGRTAPGPLMREAVNGKLVELLKRQGRLAGGV